MNEPPFQGDLNLRPATSADRFRIRGWLADSAVQTWLGNVASAEAEITLAMSSTSALCRIVECAGCNVGYGHAVEGALWAGEPEAVAPGTWSVTLFVASQEHRGQGIGTAALTQLTQEVFATTMALACCGVVPIRSEAAVRAYESAGFRWSRIWHDPLVGPAWLMLRERPG